MHNQKDHDIQKAVDRIQSVVNELFNSVNSGDDDFGIVTRLIAEVSGFMLDLLINAIRIAPLTSQTMRVVAYITYMSDLTKLGLRYFVDNENIDKELDGMIRGMMTGGQA